MERTTVKVETFELVDHGIEHSDYFQGCGTSFTSYTDVATGIGSNFAEAYDDACEMMAQQADVSIDFTDLDKRVLKKIGRRKLPQRPAVGAKHGDGCYYHLSIRYTLPAVTDKFEQA